MPSENCHPPGCNCSHHIDRRAFLSHAVAGTLTATIAMSDASAAAASPAHAKAASGERRFMEEATRLAIESVEKGWGGPFAPSL